MAKRDKEQEAQEMARIEAVRSRRSSHRFGRPILDVILTARRPKRLMLKIPVQRAPLANPSYTPKAIKLDP